MAVQVTIAGTVYNFPESGESPNWGREATETIVAMANALNTLLAPGDIFQTTFTLSNNIAVPTSVEGLIFDSVVTRAANIYYTIYRESNTTTSGKSEVGNMFIVYDDNASAGNKWLISKTSNGDAGVLFTMGDDGQVKFTSSDIGAAGYSGSIVFSARTLPR